MDARRILLLVMALVGVVVIYYLVSNFLGDQQGAERDAQAEANSRQVLVATRKLPVGTIIAQGDLQWRDWPADILAPNYITVRKGGDDQGARGKQERLNRYNAAFAVKGEIDPNRPILTEELIEIGSSGFIAAALRPGMRAVTVGINARSGLNGLISPGDRVDLMLTHQVGVSGSGIFTVTETIIHNLRVLALDARVGNVQQGGRRRTPRTVTFEAPPAMAQKVVLAAQRGTLNLALRSLATDDPEAPGDMPFDGIVTRTWDEEISPTFPRKTPFSAPASGSEQSYVVVHRGAGTSVEAVSTSLGGNVNGDVPRVRDEILEGRVLIKDQPDTDGEDK